jgi:hypothetical protein
MDVNPIKNVVKPSILARAYDGGFLTASRYGDDGLMLW